MAEKKLYIGNEEFKNNDREVTGGYVERDGETFYRIANYDRMAPFFMSIVSDSDHWMFISSTGGLTAGRKNAENALFPYYTDDKIHDSAQITGNKTVILAENGGQTKLWEPFSDNYSGLYAIRRNLYKNIPGNKLIFEEINEDLELEFRYAWMNSEKYGFVKKSSLHYTGSSKVSLEILDGIQNILPYGINLHMQTNLSTLLDAYKRSELLEDCPLGLFRLSSIPVDRAEPSEALKVTTVWTTGLNDPLILLSSKQVNQFRQGQPLVKETDVRAARGAFLVHNRMELKPGPEKTWYIVAEINQDAGQVAALNHMLSGKEDPVSLIEADTKSGTENLIKIVSLADGLQQTGDALSSRRHFANVMFNVMRGGIFENGYSVPGHDFAAYISSASTKLAQKYTRFLSSLPDWINFYDLVKECNKQNDRDLQRLCAEYLPLSFSRRHGDPSRPWNKFSIETKNTRGEKNYAYQGNWRDIFQNWEALALSFPAYLPNMLSKFVNATTADGYNPYRVTREGFEWEVLDPSDPWSNIGYWGDHQIIYLLKFLELSHQYFPGQLEHSLIQDEFVYAHLPYRIKSHADIVKDPRDTIVYDHELARQLDARAGSEGADGKLLRDSSGRIYYVNFTEKLLVPLLAKLTNFIPGAGIWLNTQRPEWNDANNALVGAGVSMVTLYYMRRFVTFCRDLLDRTEISEFPISAELLGLFTAVLNSLSANKKLLASGISDAERRKILDLLGQAGSEYRNNIYTNGFSGSRQELSKASLIEFFDQVTAYLDQSIRSNKRPDNLYHAYNLISFDSSGPVRIRHLYEMLEGQVAVLSSGLLSVHDSIQVLSALRSSTMFRPDQHSYILYPDRQLPRFTEINIIPVSALRESKLLKRLCADPEQEVIYQDVKDVWHFNGSVRNSAMLLSLLKKLPAEKYGALLEKEAAGLVLIFDEIFDHQSFTGRSGTFFGYEGLGSIYWHMVSKLLLVVGEIFHRAVREGAEKAVLRELKNYYYDIRKGIGVDKSPQNYGAFPTDPYSHTPAHKGAQQPGLTGQVKEDILSRFMELGISVRNGEIHFSPQLLRPEEFSSKPGIFLYYDLEGNLQTLDLPARSLAFTYCQIPVVYELANENKLVISESKGRTEQSNNLSIDAGHSAQIFQRGSRIRQIGVNLLPQILSFE